MDRVEKGCARGATVNYSWSQNSVKAKRTPKVAAPRAIMAIVMV
jgi:hypothetical protein